MLSLIVLVVGAALLGLARGGSIDSLAETRFKWVWLIFAGFALQFATQLWEPRWLASAGGPATILAANALIALFLVLNRGLPGVPLAAAGMLLNIVVITANGAMPVSPRAAEIAGLQAPRAGAELKHEPLDDETLLPWLGDTIPMPGLREVLSLGDVVLNLGLARLVYMRTTASRRRGRHHADT